MKKTNFTERLNAINPVVQEAIKFIETAPIKNGQTIKLMKKGEDINEMPTVTRVDKHNCYDEFGVVSVSKPEKTVLPTEIVLHLQGKGEASDEKREVTLGDLGSYYVLDDYYTCLLADMISKKLSNK